MAEYTISDLEASIAAKSLSKTSSVLEDPTPKKTTSTNPSPTVEDFVKAFTEIDLGRPSFSEEGVLPEDYGSSQYDRNIKTEAQLYDLNENRANSQTGLDKFGNTVAKFTTSLGSNTLGGIVGLPVGVAEAVFYEAPKQAYKSFKRGDSPLEVASNTGAGLIKGFTHNEVYLAMGEFQNKVSENFPHYYTQAEREKSFMQQLGTYNFWGDKAVNGLSFLASAILTEGASMAIQGAIMGSRVAAGSKLLQYGSEGARAATLSKAIATGVADVSTIGRVGTLLRQLGTGAGFESAMESREAYDNIIDNFLTNGKDLQGKPIAKRFEHNPDLTREQKLSLLSEDERWELEKEATFLQNGVFAGNMVVVGISNMVMLGGLYGAGITKRMDYFKGLRMSAAEKATEIGGKIAARAPLAGKIGSAINSTGVKAGTKWAARGLYEGVEEGGQGYMRSLATNYAEMSSLSNDGFTYELGAVGAAFAQANQDTLYTTEGRTEIFLGALMGLMGVPTKLGGGGMFWTEATAEERAKTASTLSLKAFQKKHVDAITEVAKANPNFGKGLVVQMVAVANMHKRQDALDQAIKDKDFATAKSLEMDNSLDMFIAMDLTGKLSSLEKDFEKNLKLDGDAFKAAFGYAEEMTTAQIEERKVQLNNSFKSSIKSYRDSVEAVDKVYSLTNDAKHMQMANPNSPAFRRRVMIHAAMSAENRDMREKAIIAKIAELVGGDITSKDGLVDTITIQTPDGSKVLNIGTMNAYTIDDKGVMSVTTVESQIRETSDRLQYLAAIPEKQRPEDYNQVVEDLTTLFDVLKKETDIKKPVLSLFLENGNSSEAKTLDEWIAQDPLRAKDKEDLQKLLGDARRLRVERHEFATMFQKLTTEEGRKEMDKKLASLQKSIDAATAAKGTDAEKKAAKSANVAAFKEKLALFSSDLTIRLEEFEKSIISKKEELAEKLLLVEELQPFMEQIAPVTKSRKKKRGQPKKKYTDPKTGRTIDAVTLEELKEAYYEAVDSIPVLESELAGIDEAVQTRIISTTEIKEQLESLITVSTPDPEYYASYLKGKDKIEAFDYLKEALGLPEDFNYESFTYFTEGEEDVRIAFRDALALMDEGVVAMEASVGVANLKLEEYKEFLKIYETNLARLGDAGLAMYDANPDIKANIEALEKMVADAEESLKDALDERKKLASSYNKIRRLQAYMKAVAWDASTAHINALALVEESIEAALFEREAATYNPPKEEDFLLPDIADGFLKTAGEHENNYAEYMQLMSLRSRTVDQEQRLKYVKSQVVWYDWMSKAESAKNAAGTVGVTPMNPFLRLMLVTKESLDDPSIPQVLKNALTEDMFYGDEDVKAVAVTVHLVNKTYSLVTHQGSLVFTSLMDAKDVSDSGRQRFTNKSKPPKNDADIVDIVDEYAAWKETLRRSKTPRFVGITGKSNGVVIRNKDEKAPLLPASTAVMAHTSQIKLIAAVKQVGEDKKTWGIPVQPSSKSPKTWVRFGDVIAYDSVRGVIVPADRQKLDVNTATTVMRLLHKQLVETAKGVATGLQLVDAVRAAKNTLLIDSEIKDPNNDKEKVKVKVTLLEHLEDLVMLTRSDPKFTLDTRIMGEELVILYGTNPLNDGAPYSLNLRELEVKSNQKLLLDFLQTKYHQVNAKTVEASTVEDEDVVKGKAATKGKNARAATKDTKKPNGKFKPKTPWIAVALAEDLTVRPITADATHKSYSSYLLSSREGSSYAPLLFKTFPYKNPLSIPRTKGAYLRFGSGMFQGRVQTPFNTYSYKEAGGITEEVGGLQNAQSAGITRNNLTQAEDIPWLDVFDENGDPIGQPAEERDADEKAFAEPTEESLEGEFSEEDTLSEQRKRAMEANLTPEELAERELAAAVAMMSGTANNETVETPVAEESPLVEESSEDLGDPQGNFIYAKILNEGVNLAVKNADVGEFGQNVKELYATNVKKLGVILRVFPGGDKKFEYRFPFGVPTKEIQEAIIELFLAETGNMMNLFQAQSPLSNMVQESISEETQRVLKMTALEITPTQEFLTAHGVESVAQLTDYGQVLLSSYAPGGVLYHEAFHNISLYTLSAKDSKYLYNKVREIPGSIVTFRGETKELSKLSNKEAEEWLAEEFRAYMLDPNYKIAKDSVKDTRSAIKKFFDYLKTLLRRLNKVDENFEFDPNLNSVEGLFKAIEGGKFLQASRHIDKLGHMGVYGMSMKDAGLSTTFQKDLVEIFTAEIGNVVMDTQALNPTSLEDLFIGMTLPAERKRVSLIYAKAAGRVRNKLLAKEEELTALVEGKERPIEEVVPYTPTVVPEQKEVVDYYKLVAQDFKSNLEYLNNKTPQKLQELRLKIQLENRDRWFKEAEKNKTDLYLSDNFEILAHLKKDKTISKNTVAEFEKLYKEDLELKQKSNQLNSKVLSSFLNLSDVAREEVRSNPIYKNKSIGENFTPQELKSAINEIENYILRQEPTSSPVPEQSEIKAITMQPDNIAKILSGEKTSTVRTDNMPSGVYNIGGQLFNLTNRGLLSIDEAGGVSAISKSEAFAKTGPKYSSTKEFLAGKRKLYVLDITKATSSPVLEKQTATKKKPSSELALNFMKLDAVKSYLEVFGRSVGNGDAELIKELADKHFAEMKFKEFEDENTEESLSKDTPHDREAHTENPMSAESAIRVLLSGITDYTNITTASLPGTYPLGLQKLHGGKKIAGILKTFQFWNKHSTSLEDVKRVLKEKEKLMGKGRNSNVPKFPWVKEVIERIERLQTKPKTVLSGYDKINTAKNLMLVSITSQLTKADVQPNLVLLQKQENANGVANTINIMNVTDDTEARNIINEWSNNLIALIDSGEAPYVTTLGNTFVFDPTKPVYANDPKSSFIEIARSIPNASIENLLLHLKALGIEFSNPEAIVQAYTGNNSSEDYSEETFNRLKGLRDNLGTVFSVLAVSPNTPVALYSRSTSDIVSRMRKFVDMEMKYGDRIKESSAHIHGKAEYDIVERNAVTIIADSDLSTLPQLDPANAPFVLNSITVAVQADRKKRGEKTTLEVRRATGIEEDKSGEPGAKTNKLYKSEILAEKIRTLQEGFTPLPPTADKNTVLSVALNIWEEFENSDGQVTFKESADKLLGYLEAEILSSVVGMRELSYISKYEDNIKKLRFFEGILSPGSNKLVQDMLQDKAWGDKVYKEYSMVDKNGQKNVYSPALDSFIEKNSAAFKVEIEEHIKKYVTNLYTELEALDMIKSTGLNNTVVVSGIDSRMLNKGEKESLAEVHVNTLDRALTDIVLRNLIGDIELFKVFFGDPAFYSDLFKRLGGVVGSKMMGNTDKGAIAFFGSDAIAAGFATEDGMFTGLTIEEPIYVNKKFKQGLGKELQEIFKEPVDMADGSIFVLPEMYRMLEGLTNQWSFEKEEMYQNLKASKANKTPYQPIYGGTMSPTKPQYHGPAKKEGKYYIPTFLKMAIFPLDESMSVVNGVTYKNISTIIEFMRKNKVGFLVLPSAQKVGGIDPKQMILPKINEKLYHSTGEIQFISGKKGSVDPRAFTEFDIKYMGSQLRIAPEAHNTVSLATQARTQTLTDIYDEGQISEDIFETPERRVVVEDLTSDYKNTLSNLTRALTKNLLKKLDIPYVQDETTGEWGYMMKENSYQNILKVLEAASKKNSLGEQISEGIEHFKTLPSFKVEHFVAGSRIEKMLYSHMEGKVTRPKLTGAGMVLSPNFGYEFTEKVDKNGNSVVTADRLKMGINEETGKYEMEILIPHYFKEFFGEELLITNEGIVDPKSPDGKVFPGSAGLLKMLGMRIPTDGLHSVEVIRVKGFLPQIMGPRVVVPELLVLKAGSDFDIDKLTMYFQSFRVKDGVLSREIYRTVEDYFNEMVEKSESGLYTEEDLIEFEAEIESAENIIARREAIKNLNTATIANMLEQLANEEYKKFHDQHGVISFGQWKEENPNVTLSSINTVGALQNHLMEVMTDLIQLPERYEDLMSPVNTNSIAAVASEILKIQELAGNPYRVPNLGGKKVEKSTRKLLLSEMLSVQQKATVQHAYWEGKSVTSIAALFSAFKVKAQVVGLQLAPRLFDSTFGNPVHVRYRFAETKHFNVDEPVPFGRIYELGESGNKITSMNSEGVNAAVDTVNTPYLHILNIGVDNASAAFSLIGIGIPLRSVAGIFTQPVVREFQSMSQISKGRVFKAFKDKLQEEDIVTNLKAKIRESGEVAETQITYFTQEQLYSMIDKPFKDMTPEERMYQLQILDDFRGYKVLGNIVGDLITHQAFDTKPPKGRIAVMFRAESYKRLLEKKQFINAESITESNQLFVAALKEFTEETPKILKDISESAKYGELYKAVMNFAVNEVLLPDVFLPYDEKVETLEKLDSLFTSMILQRVSVDGLSVGDQAERLLFSQKSLAQQVFNILKNPSHPLYENFYINHLRPIIQTAETLDKMGEVTLAPDYVQAQVRGLSQLDQSMLSEGFKEIQKYDIETGGRLMQDIMDTALLQAGTLTSPYSFLDTVGGVPYAKKVKAIFDNYKGDSNTLYLQGENDADNRSRDVLSIMVSTGLLKAMVGRDTHKSKAKRNTHMFTDLYTLMSESSISGGAKFKLEMFQIDHIKGFQSTMRELDLTNRIYPSYLNLTTNINTSDGEIISETKTTCP